MVHLQNQIPGDAQGRYMRGLNDVWYIVYWVVMFTLIRATVMYKILGPFAKWWGISSERKITRFMEQGWLTIFYVVSSSAGLFVMSHEPHWLNTEHFWINYPEGHKQMSYLMKSYYLIQMGFWFQQIFVLLIEEPRKDFLVMGIHHIVTCNLLAWSLYANYVRIGNAVLVCMDVADIFLSGTKCLRYLGFEKLAVGSFVALLVAWMYTRHYLYGKILYSVYFESRIILDDSIFDPANGSLYRRDIILMFFALLATLQGLLFYWLFLLVRIVYRIAFQGNLDDSRSDSEDSGDDSNNSSKKRTSSKKN
ncbi:Sphingosine N-acyltransferase lag1, partial [Linderina macrospora]